MDDGITRMEGLESNVVLHNGSLSELLVPYPHLAYALGDKWVKRQDGIDPAQSRFVLARMLRVDGFEQDLATLDRILDRLGDTSGIARRRERLRLDPIGFSETLTELYFSAWLLEQGYAFAWPDKGADVMVRLESGTRLAIEVTTPRISLWTQDLFERLDVLALRSGLCAHIRHEAEVFPGSEDWEGAVASIVTDASNLLEEPRYSKSSHDVSAIQSYPEYGLTISWKDTERPRVVAITSPETPTPHSVFIRAVSMARKKAHQLPSDEAGVLLIGTQNLPVSQYGSFIDAVRTWRPADLEFDWAQLPNQVKYLVFYSLEMKRIEPFDAVWITNPASPMPDAPGVIEFFQSLFPKPLHADQASDA